MYMISGFREKIFLYHENVYISINFDPFRAETLVVYTRNTLLQKKLNRYIFVTQLFFKSS
jgi:hypothetical protein